jgi:hypothetical protein
VETRVLSLERWGALILFNAVAAEVELAFFAVPRLKKRLIDDLLTILDFTPFAFVEILASTDPAIFIELWILCLEVMQRSLLE